MPVKLQILSDCIGTAQQSLRPILAAQVLSDWPIKQVKLLTPWAIMYDSI